MLMWCLQVCGACLLMNAIITAILLSPLEVLLRFATLLFLYVVTLIIIIFGDHCTHPLTLTGHVHAYERTFPVLSGEVSTEQGVVYLTIGAGGNHEGHAAGYDEVTRVVTPSTPFTFPPFSLPLFT